MFALDPVEFVKISYNVNHRQGSGSINGALPTILVAFGVGSWCMEFSLPQRALVDG
jgi:hypothetical protein